ncbi:KilA-N domain-containing protein [Escherichia coli]
MQPEQQALPIVLKDASGKMHEFKSENGMYNLTDIHQLLGLPKNKLPSQWRNEVSREFERNANLHSYNKRGACILATEAATIAYAMWVSIEFYMLVVNVFIAVRNDALLSAKVASKLSDEQRDFLRENSAALKEWKRLKAKTHWTFYEAAKLAELEHPHIARIYIHAFMSFYTEHTSTIRGRRRTEFIVTPKGEEAGFFSTKSSDAGIQLRVAKSGLEWLISNREEINRQCNYYRGKTRIG